MSKIKKAVIPAIGLGSSFLPATKSQPKEMLPIVDKPTLQYIVEEAIKSGIEEILIITDRNKQSIEDYFDKSIELELELDNKNKKELISTVKKLSDMIDINYIRQKEARGLGDAIYCARHFIGDEAFAVMLCDDIIDSKIPCLKQLMYAYEEYRTTIIGVQKVGIKDSKKYGIISPKHIEDRVYKVKDLLENLEMIKSPSNMAIFGRYIMTPEIFKILKYLKTSNDSAISLMEVLKLLCKKEAVYAYDFEGKIYDVGDKLGFLEATIDFALKRDDIKIDFLKYLNLICGGFNSRNQNK